MKHKLLMISGDRSLAQGKKGAFYNTLEEFHKYWDRIDVITPRITNYELRITNLFDNVFIHSSPWPLLFQPFWILKKGREIYREHKFDLMTVHEYPPFYNGLGARMLWNKIRVPYILEIFHIVGYPKAADLKERIYRQFFYAFIEYDSKKAKAIRVMNSQVAEKLVNLGVLESKIKLIPAIYVDSDIFRPMALEKKYDLVFVGRLVKNKGVKLLIEAAKVLKSIIHNSKFKILIVGDGPLKKLEVRSKKLGLEDNIVFYGWAKDSEEVAKLLNQSRVLVMPSYSEGGPRVVIEAMACGLPIVATPVGIMADILKDGQFVEITTWNSKDIAEKINYIFTNQSVYQKHSQAGLEIAKRFEKKSTIKNYAKKLRELSTD